MINYEYSSKARTYLILDEEEVKAESYPLHVFGYFSLSFKDFDIDEEHFKSKSERKKTIRNYSGFPFSLNTTHFQAYLIGQLGKNLNIQNNPLTGQKIIEEAMKIILDAIPIIGGRLVLVECNPGLKSFYEKNGFSYASKTFSSKGKIMYQMVRKVEIEI